MITFERAIVVVKTQANDDSLYFADWGYENDDYWEVLVGDKRWLVDNDQNYLAAGDSMFLVSKTTGVYELRSAIVDLDFMASFKPYGNVPAFFQ